MVQNFGNLDWIDGQVSVPGIYPELYYIPKSWILSWPQLDPAPLNVIDEVTLKGDFQLAVGKTWKKINCIDLKSQPTSEQQGEVRCKTYLNKLKVVVSLTNEEATSLAKIGANTDMVFMFRERDSGKYRVASRTISSRIRIETQEQKGNACKTPGNLPRGAIITRKVCC